MINNIKNELKQKNSCALCGLDKAMDTIVHLLLDGEIFTIYRQKYLLQFNFTREYIVVDKLHILLNCTSLNKIKPIHIYLKICLNLKKKIEPWLANGH